MFLVRIYKTSIGYEKRHLNYFSAVSMIIAVYLMIIILLQNIISFDLWARIISCILLLILLASPLRIAVNAQKDEERYADRFLLEKNPLIIHPEASRSSEENAMQYHEVPGSKDEVKTSSSNRMVQDDEEDLNILQALCTLNFWLLFIAMVCGMGSGLATINNISQIGQSLSYPTVAVNSLVSLWSIWNFLGRFGAGFLSDICLHYWKLERPLFMVITLAALTCGHLIIASGFPGNLYVGSILIGICYGSQWSLMPTITSEIFGVGHMGTIFNTIAIASPVGSYIFSVRVIGYFYDKRASNTDNSCTGIHCFRVSFLVMASVALFGSLAAFILYLKTRGIYRRVVLRRLEHSSRS